MSKPWTPHGYQQRGISKLVSRLGAGLLLDPGMGKTTTALAAFELLREKGLAKKMLVIAPIKPMYGTWPAETQKWTDFEHLTTTIIHGPKKEKMLYEDTDIYVINPEAVVWLFNHKESELPDWDILCVDESTKFKNSTSKRFKAIKKRLHWFSKRWILTGTFSPNGLEDLFGQVYIMDRGEAIGKFITHYRNLYFYSDPYNPYSRTPFDGAAATIAEKIAPMVLKLDAEDYLDMPEFLKIIRPITLPPEVMVKYKEVEKDFITNLQTGTIVASNAGAAGTKCRQMANGAVYDENRGVHVVHDEKLKALEEIVEETNGHPLLIMYEYEHDKDRVMEFLGKDAVCITGVTGNAFTSIQDRFNAGEIPYLIAHGGNVHGLNIQGHCFHMVWYGITWNLESFIQSVWRLYRQGQSSKIVLCYMLVALGTLDERVVEVLNEKERNQDEVDSLLMTYEVNDELPTN